MVSVSFISICLQYLELLEYVVLAEYFRFLHFCSLYFLHGFKLLVFQRRKPSGNLQIPFHVSTGKWKKVKFLCPNVDKAVVLIPFP